MTREELYQSIYTHDTIYLPPHAQATAALEVSLGCSWHKCTFCDFAKDRFQIHPIDKIEHNLKYFPNCVRRIHACSFLEKMHFL